MDVGWDRSDWKPTRYSRMKIKEIIEIETNEVGDDDTGNRGNEDEDEKVGDRTGQETGLDKTGDRTRQHRVRGARKN